MAALPTMADRAGADIVLVNPRFEASYWGLEDALPLLGKRAAMPVASLPLLAALTPPPHRVTHHRRERHADRLRRHRPGRHRRPHRHERPARADARDPVGAERGGTRSTVVGGPWVSVAEDYFDGLADVSSSARPKRRGRVSWTTGSAARSRPATSRPERTDMTRVPVPRYDLLDMPQYLFGSVQFSRGCPFQCEFCDIIVTFGRRPRLKTPAQVIAELEAAARAADGDRLHRRRQPDRQQESHRAAARGRPARGRRRTGSRSSSSPRPRSTSPRTPS